MKEKPDEQWMEAFYRGLKALEDCSFPRVCPKCGKTFQDLQQFIAQTEPVAESSGLGEWDIGDGKPFVGLFRNCLCRSTLMHYFHDRRDESPAGRERRKRFEDVVEILKRGGLDEETARTELRRIMRNEHSDIIAEMGIKLGEKG